MAAPRVGAPAPIDPVPFGRYVLLDRVAQGRLASVHRALQRREGEPDALFALKRFEPELSRDRRFADRAERVMARAAQLRHTGHCAIAEVERSADGTLYAALEWVAGKDLRRIAMALRERGETMPAALVAHVGSRIAEVLAAAHAMSRAGKPAPLLHGELSTADILIGYDGRVRLIGLGSAELAAAAQIPAARLAYQAPEIGRGAACSAQSDVFSLGACLYQALSFGAAAGARGVVRGSDSHVTQIIPRALKQILDQSLATQPETRWQSAAELAHQLQSWSSTQSQPGDAGALAAFMRRLFEGAREADERHVQALIAALPAGARATDAQAGRPAPPARPAQSARASQLRARLQPRSKPPAAPPEPAREDPWGDAAERTPPQGALMQQLAAGMVGAPQSPRGDAQRESAGAPATAASASQPGPHLTVQGWDDDVWDNDTPVNPWISSAEERAAVAKPRSRAPLPPPPAESAAPPPPPPAQSAAPPLAPPPIERLLPSPGTKRRNAWLMPSVIAAGALGLLVVGLLVFRGASTEVGTSPEHEPPSAARAPARTPPIQNARAANPANAATAATDATRAPAPPAEAATQDDTSPRTEAAPDRRAPEPPRGREVAQRSDTRERGQSSALVAPADDVEPPPSPPAADEQHPAPVLAVTQVVEPAPQPTSVPAPAPAPVPVAASPAMPPRPAAKAPAAARGPSREAILVAQAAPRVPSRAKRLAITEGVVSIAYTIDKNGAVKDAAVVSADPPGIFDEAALKAIQQWKYQPKLIDGAPAESHQRFTFRFQ